MAETMIKGLYNAPPGCDAIAAVAKALAVETGGDMEALQACTLLLPTRRAIRLLEEALPKALSMTTVLLPKLMAIGDIELPPEEDEQGRPPPRAISGIERLYSLMPFLEAENLGTQSFDAAWRMAGEAARLIDLLHTEDFGPEALERISREALPEHWQDNIGAFQRAATAWLNHLEDTRRLNSAAARTHRINRLMQQWAENTPEHPVWLIGSTGSIPAVRRLMDAVLKLPRGAVLLPGVDMHLDDAEWAALPDAHPQAILKKTLSRYDRRELQCWPGCDVGPEIEARMRWLSAALSPYPKRVAPDDTTTLALCTAASVQDEIATVAHICTHELAKNPKAKIVIVANDPDLPYRLMPWLAPYGIAVDASSGLRLDTTGYGQRLLTLIGTLDDDGDILGVLTLLKQPGFAGYSAERAGRLTEIENKRLRDAMRAPKTIAGFAALVDDTLLQNISALQAEWQDARPLSDWARQAQAMISTWLVARGHEDRCVREAVDTLLETVAGLRLPRRLDRREAIQVLREQLSRLTCRLPVAPTRRSVHVLGTLEARLLHADIAILTGLNEGTWPDMPQPSPFVSRKMRHDIGLPDSERHAALSGHDFQQAVMAPIVYMTRAARNNEGSPALPARWLQRLKAVTPPEDWRGIENNGAVMHSARTLYHSPNAVRPAAPPQPVSTTLPDPLFVTHVETWRQDPYSFWAKHILGLKSLDPLLPEIDAATRGTIWHEIFKNFVLRFDVSASQESQENLFMTEMEDAFERRHLPEDRRRLWRARLGATAPSLVAAEYLRRENAQPDSVEDKHKGEVAGITLFARADRIDRRNDDLRIVCDYKTGDAPTKISIRLGYSCQLSLLACLLGQPVAALEYISVKGGRATPKSLEVEWDDALAQETAEGFAAWCRMFIEQGQAFISLADHGKDHRKKAQDYLHLARHQEWGAA